MELDHDAAATLFQSLTYCCLIMRKDFLQFHLARRIGVTFIGLTILATAGQKERKKVFQQQQQLFMVSRWSQITINVQKLHIPSHIKMYLYFIGQSCTEREILGEGNNIILKSFLLLLCVQYEVPIIYVYWCYFWIADDDGRSYYRNSMGENEGFIGYDDEVMGVNTDSSIKLSASDDRSCRTVFASFSWIRRVWRNEKSVGHNNI